MQSFSIGTILSQTLEKTLSRWISGSAGRTSPKPTDGFTQEIRQLFNELNKAIEAYSSNRDFTISKGQSPSFDKEIQTIVERSLLGFLGQGGGISQGLGGAFFSLPTAFKTSSSQSARDWLRGAGKGSRNS